MRKKYLSLRGSDYSRPESSRELRIEEGTYHVLRWLTVNLDKTHPTSMNTITTITPMICLIEYKQAKNRIRCRARAFGYKLLLRRNFQTDKCRPTIYG